MSFCEDKPEHIRGVTEELEGFRLPGGIITSSTFTKLNRTNCHQVLLRDDDQKRKVKTTTSFYDYITRFLLITERSCGQRDVKLVQEKNNKILSSSLGGKQETPKFQPAEVEFTGFYLSIGVERSFSDSVDDPSPLVVYEVYTEANAMILLAAKCDGAFSGHRLRPMDFRSLRVCRGPGVECVDAGFLLYEGSVLDFSFPFSFLKTFYRVLRSIRTSQL